ncbi:MAG: hypothetical protein KC502_10520 [Myxococcales bacterium]|nr:hypothetical protein [Myxococcales bacterium]
MIDSQHDRSILIAGLLVPGAGQLLRKDYVSALALLAATLFFWLAAAIELIVANQAGYPAPLVLMEALAALQPPLTVLPQLVYAVVCALTMHVGGAWLASRAR